MKKNSGITLVSLTVYIVVMILAIGIISTILIKFQENTNKIEADSKDVIEVANFNTYFLKEVKLQGNKVDSIENNYILFSSGNSFSLANGKVYYNDIQICKGINQLRFELNENDDTVITVYIELNDFSKTMNYKVEEIY